MWKLLVKIIIFSFISLILIVGLISLLSAGCARPDTDVSALPKYNFQAFSGTTWKTKVKMVLADVKNYKGDNEPTLLPPRWFDTKHPGYDPSLHPKKILAEYPMGTRLRIDRLMQDNDNWGGVKVLAIVEDGRTVYLSSWLFAKNKFVHDGPSLPEVWNVDPEMLEKTQ